MNERRAPLFLVVSRIAAVLGIGVAAATGLFLLIGGFWREGLLALAAALGFVGLMFVIERDVPGG